MVRTPEENEQFVRKCWENVGLMYGRIDGGRYWMVYQHGRGIPLHGYESPELAWAAAAEFTEQRLGEIREVEEEIAALLPFAAGRTEEALTLMPVWAKKATIPALLSEGKAILRTIARLRRALAELNKWMRP